MANPQPPWALKEFGRAIDNWIAQDHPTSDLIIHVCAWIFTRAVDPYQGVSRESGFRNLWWGEVPGTRIDDTAVMCAYWIVEDRHQVNGESIATLSWPF